MGFSIVAALLWLGSLFAIHRATREQRTASSWVRHSYEVLHELEAAQESLARGEAHARGYALTSDESLAMAVEHSLAEAQRHLSLARSLTQDHVGQARRLRALTTAMGIRVDQLRETVERAKTRRPTEEIIPQPALQLSKHIHGELDTAIEVEHSLLAARHIEHEARAQTFRSRIVSSGSLALLLGLLLSLSVRKQNTARRAAERQARIFFESSLDMLAIASHTGQFVSLNEAWAKTLGWTAEELTRVPYLEFVHPDDHEATLREAASLRTGKPTTAFRNRYRTRDGSYRWLDWTMRPTDDGLLFCIARDISLQVQNERIVREQAAILRSVLDSMSDAVMVVDTNAKILLHNEAMRATLGVLPDADPDGWPTKYGIYLADQQTLCPEDHVPTLRALRGETVEQEEFWLAMPGSEEGRWHSVSASPVRDERGDLLGAVRVGRDITMRKRMEAEIRDAAVRDGLTCLYNRRGFTLMAEQQLRVAERRGESLVLLFVDLNGMKQINDELGHEVGDQALVATGELLRATFRASDVIARLGGDEFVVLAEGDAEAAERLRTRVLAEVAARAGQFDHFKLSLAVGVAMYDPKQPRALSELLAEADQAMYEAKRRSRANGGRPSIERATG